VTVVVVDASVSVKWFLSPAYEPLCPEAAALYGRYLSKEIEFIIPDIFWAELGSAFWKAVRLGRFQRPSAEAAIASLMKCDLPTFSSAKLLERAFQIATKYDRSVYDSLYVALAEKSNAELITADERLANALAAHFPIRWLGSYPVTP
jgi:predicted nucleic acid-binding protein